ncbi:MAG: YbhN family protein, partial [Actinomycetota bacterium]|nr:YbhN family protein [Actinomycetota bacterium]
MVAAHHRGATGRWWHRGPFARREVRISVGIVLLFLFVFYVAIPLLATHRAEVESLGHIHPLYLALGVVLEIGALLAYTELSRSVLPRPGPRRSTIFRINLSTLALSHVSPGGTAPGAALGYRLYLQAGVSGPDTGFALGTQGIGSAVVLNVIFWLALVGFLASHGLHAPASQGPGHSTSGTILVMVAASIGIVLLGAFGGIFALLTRGQHWAGDLLRRLSSRVRFLDPDRTAAMVEHLAERFSVLVEDRPLMWRAAGWAAVNWLLDAASLWVFVAAFSHFISPVDLLVAYGLANILAVIPLTPGGLGVVEFVLVSMITGFGPSAGEALSGVLAYRAVNFWFPIPLGGVAYASLRLQRGAFYRRLHLFFLRRYERRREPGGQETGAGRPAGSVTDDRAAPAAGGSGGPATSRADPAGTAAPRVGTSPGPGPGRPGRGWWPRRPGNAPGRV